jgi:methyl-accepting chemotaxis protein
LGKKEKEKLYHNPQLKMLNIKIDIKLIFIFILAIALILTIIFRPSKPIETYENEINALKKVNKELLISNDSIAGLNKKLEKEIQQILFTIDSTKALLKNSENKIKELEKQRDEISDIVDDLHSDGVTKSISDYLKRRGKDPS